MQSKASQSSVNKLVPGGTGWNANQKFAAAAIILQIIIIILFILFVEYDFDADAKGEISLDRHINERYPFFQDVHVMIFIGFGFLMTFLQRHGFAAVGFTFMIGALSIEWSILCHGFWSNVHEEFVQIRIQLEQFILSDFAAGSVLIAYGVVIGRVNALQLLVMAFIQIIFYSLNEMILYEEFVVADIGGTMVIHTFGAYFGLACSLAMGSPTVARKYPGGHPKNGANKMTDTMAMVGTVFLWLFWPSFNAAMADGSRQHRTVINTILSLCGACMAAFAASALFRPHNKFSMVDVQNATLAGGVAVGCSADLVLEPYGAIIIGTVGGLLSVAGYVFITPFLERKIGLLDTCGVNNLHGMPGVFGSICCIIVSAIAPSKGYSNIAVNELWPERAPVDEGGSGRSAQEQAQYQLAGLVVTLALAIITGLPTGWLLSHPFFAGPQELYDDVESWHTEEDDHDRARVDTEKTVGKGML